LSDLVGPRDRVIELPLRMDWSQRRRYDLSRDGERRLLYETVLNEALRVDDLHGLLNAELLVELWPALWLPRRIRDLWESRFPELASSGRSPPRAIPAIVATGTRRPMNVGCPLNSRGW
jgi:hypothetical protein